MASVRFKDKKFYKKAEYFSEFIQKNDRINLILGSSLIENSVIPDSLGPKWFAFANPAQNIYESYKFIDYYKDSVKIDTIIIGIQPFDFSLSYIQYYNNDGRSLCGSFYIFGEDSITILKRDKNQNKLKKNIQYIKEKHYLGLDQIIKKIRYQKKTPLEAVWTLQGFSGRRNAKPVNLDKLFPQFLKGRDVPGSTFNRHTRYFENVLIPPNLDYFNIFNSLAESIGTKTIYLITPKSKYYHRALIADNFDKIWNSILDSLNTRPIELWNYEAMETDTFDFHYYWDETHSSYQGARVFTKMIKTRL